MAIFQLQHNWRDVKILIGFAICMLALNVGNQYYNYAAYEQKNQSNIITKASITNATSTSATSPFTNISINISITSSSVVLNSTVFMPQNDSRAGNGTISTTKSTTISTTNSTTTMNLLTFTTTKTGQKFMSSIDYGRLGNKMGAHAVSLGLAQINGYKAVMNQYMVNELGQYFDLTTPMMDEETKNHNFTVMTFKDYMQEEYRHLNNNYVQLNGYVNSWTFFHHVKTVVLKDFSFKKQLQDESQRILHEIASTVQRNVVFVGVHVRRTDYIQVMRDSWRGVIGDMKYLEEAMGIFRARYNNSVFVVASDDLKWCKENFNLSLGDVFIPGNSSSSPGQDMATLVACNHTIMTIGTFGFWASYLCGGDVIYLANYTLPDSLLLLLLLILLHKVELRMLVGNNNNNFLLIQHLHLL